MSRVLLGADRWEAMLNKGAKGPFGLLTTAGATDGNGTPTVDLLARHLDVRVLFGPEHGVRGTIAAGDHVSSGVDEATGIRIVSLYGARYAPDKDDLADIATLIVDVPDVGSRCYTYLSTVSHTLEACARADVHVVVLDRPNPVSGTIVEGTILRTPFSSFVGLHPIPARHGFTVAEYSIWLVSRMADPPRLTVIECDGWNRSEFWEETGLAWHRPSPNLRTPASAITYVGTCLFEGTNVSEGRGTERPLELIGAPWMDSERILEGIDERLPAGAAFEPASFVPAASKHEGETCQGISISVTDPHAFRPYQAGVVLLDAIRRTHTEFAFRSPGKDGRWFIDLLSGDDAIRSDGFDLDAYLARCNEESAGFAAARDGALLYE